MKTTIALLFAAGLLMAVPVAGATGEERDREALHKELAEARRELAEAAGHVAELAREIGVEAGDMHFRVLAPGGMEFGPRRAMLGIAIGERDGKQQGVEVLSVTPGGPADKAGIRVGDIITAIGATDLAKADSGSRAVVESLEAIEPGSVIEVKYRRGDDARTAKVTTESVDMHMRFARRLADGMPHDLPGLPRVPMFLELMHGWGDIELAPLSPQLGEYFGADKGLLVIRAPKDAEFKLQDGDVILAIDGREPEDAGHAMRILRSYRGGEKLSLDILRKRKKMSLEISVPERLNSEHLPSRRREIVVGAAAAPL